MTIKIGPLTINVKIEKREKIRVEINDQERARMVTELTSSADFQTLKKQAAALKAARLSN